MALDCEPTEGSSKDHFRYAYRRISINLQLTSGIEPIIMIGMAENQPVPMRLTAAIAQKRIREIAEVTENVILGTHARERMEEREIFDVDVFRILRTGHIDEAPVKTERDEWKCKLVRKIRGGRSAGVVTIILHNGKLFVKTVEWEDVL